MISRRLLIVAGLGVSLALSAVSGPISNHVSAAATQPVPTSGQSAPVPGPTQPQKPARKLGGITVAPAFQNVVVSDDKPTDTYEFSLTNNTSEPVEFALSAVDFGSLDESGGVLFLGNSEKSLNYRYGLARYTTLERDRLTIEPKQTEKVKLTITNKESLTPGGHYGAILATPTQNGQRPTRVQVNQVLSSLLFVRKQGGEVYQLSLRDFGVKRQLFDAPKSVDLRFQNAGNVHVIPRGIATITDPRGREVRRGFINGGSAIILPQTFRRLSLPLENTSTAWIPGRYTLTIAFRYDGSEQLQTKTYSFIYFNAWYIVFIIAIVILAVLLAVNLRLRRVVVASVRRVVRWVRTTARRVFAKLRTNH